MEWPRFWPNYSVRHEIIWQRNCGRYGNPQLQQPDRYGREAPPPPPPPPPPVNYGASALKKEPMPPVRKNEVPAPQVSVQAQREENTYDVTQGSLVTTAYNLRLEGLGVKGEDMEFTGDASGIFTVSASPLKRARLRTKDLLALRTRGTLFSFDFRPSRLEVRFFDPKDQETPLAVLYAEPVPAAANSGFGTGRWSTSF